jgi:hypothetical protein
LPSTSKEELSNQKLAYVSFLPHFGCEKGFLPIKFSRFLYQENHKLLKILLFFSIFFNAF